jgi:hypothetical protein
VPLSLYIFDALGAGSNHLRMAGKSRHNPLKTTGSSEQPIAAMRARSSVAVTVVARRKRLEVETKRTPMRHVRVGLSISGVTKGGMMQRVSLMRASGAEPARYHVHGHEA